ncbi:ubiquinol-cytochrome c reductase complex assembly factor 6 [Epargyreus clarus]|uniref:ubiquinol-cytochrome c reductase complex assembly factor 6 n=1 Tax=Epargyreus clarus TaxID=520877 RepID=UPI003C2C8191
MPVGVSWGRYITYCTAASLSMLTGSQVVHLYFKPMMDLNKYINKELENLPENVQVQIREELKEEGILK